MTEDNVKEQINEEEVLEEQVDENEEIQFDDDGEEEASNEVEDKYEDKYIRLLAEFDNYKKRTAKEHLSASDNGKVKVFEKLVDTIDTLNKALEQNQEETDFTNGIKMTYDKLKRDMNEMGLEEVSYEQFDPNYHMAVLTESIEDKEDDEIIDVLQKGYKYNDKLVRQAMVKVNKK